MVKLMPKNELKWYDTFDLLFGIILGFADPITDILTLVEFYRADHKTWFGVGLTFILLPSFFFFVIYLLLEVGKDEERDDEELEQEECQCTAWKYTHILVLGCNPLLPAWLKLRTLYSHGKKQLLKLRQVDNIGQTGEDSDKLKAESSHLLVFSKAAVLAEAAVESAPQFIIQLYAMAVQQQSVSIVQMVSLPVSFLSLAWASIVADNLIYSDLGADLNFRVIDGVLRFVTHLFILSSRLFAVALFTVSYKWWVTGVLILHCTVITISEIVWLCRVRGCNGKNSFRLVIVFCFHWLRDDLSTRIDELNTENKKKHLRMQLFSNVLFVIENITMILLFYFSHFPHTWYSLPVTICVCLFAVLGAIMRLTHFYFLIIKKESDDQSNDNPQVQQPKPYINPVVEDEAQ